MDTRFADHKWGLKNIQECMLLFIFHIELRLPRNLQHICRKLKIAKILRETIFFGTNICDVLAGSRVNYTREPH